MISRRVALACACLFALAGSFGCKRHRHRPARRPSPAVVSGTPAATASAAAGEVEGIVGRRIDVDVGEHGFQPSAIDVKKGEPTTLVFTRTSNETCALDVVFPELGLDKTLPLRKPVPVEVPVDQGRTLTFTCGMGMYKSTVVIR